MKVLARITLALLVILATASPGLALTFTGKCVDAYDGDTVTVMVNGRKEKIRLIGIDTAEMGQGEWGKKARDFTRSLVLNKDVRVETDVEPRDKYGRLLGYVYVGSTFVNLELMRQGYAVLLTYPPNVAHTGDFTAAQKEARDKGLNIWDSVNGLKQTPHDFRHGGHSKGKYFTGGGTFKVKGGADALRSKIDKAAPKVIVVQPREAISEPSSDNKTETGADLVSLNTRSGKYHEPGCRYYGCANCREVSRAEAQAQGVPCKVCH
jgi:micrococcal nuclease